MFLRPTLIAFVTVLLNANQANTGPQSPVTHPTLDLSVPFTCYISSENHEYAKLVFTKATDEKKRKVVVFKDLYLTDTTTANCEFDENGYKCSWITGGSIELDLHNSKALRADEDLLHITILGQFKKNGLSMPKAVRCPFTYLNK